MVRGALSGVGTPKDALAACPFHPPGGRRTISISGFQRRRYGSAPRSRVSGDAVAMRDRVVRWVLGGGGVLALLVGFFIGPWPAMVLALPAPVGAAAAYRVEPPRIDLDGTPWLDDTVEPEPSRALDQ